MQISLEPEILTAGMDVSSTVIVIFLQTVLLHVPSALKKYVVEEVGLTVILDPEPTSVPAHDPLYHFQLAPSPSLPPFTDNVELVPRQMVVVPLIEVAGKDVS